MKKIIVTVLFLIFIIGGCSKTDNKTSEIKSPEQKQEVTTGENKSSDNEVVEIKLPTVQCGMCKKNIETAVKKIDGVNSIKVNVKDKSTVVEYNKLKTDVNSIEAAISLAGYQANDKAANKESYDKLEACCKIGGHSN